jgi:hypothetical protein
MTPRTAKNGGHNRETLADVEREMAKPRLAESVRKAVELAEEKRSRMRLLPGAKGKDRL